MARNYSEIFLHFVWATKNREAWLTEDVREAFHAAVRKKCQDLGCPAIAVGSIDDHVHILAEMHPTVSASEFVKQVKGSSSHLINHVLKPDTVFRWQEKFGVFSLTKKGLPRVKEYVLNQRRHHTEGPVYEILERIE